MINDSERDYANSVYDSMYECGQRLAEDERKKQLVNIWNAAIDAAADLVHDEMGDPDDTFWIVEKVRKLKK